MNILKKLQLFSPVVLMAAIAGCESGKSIYVDPNGPNTVVTLDEINIQDWNKAAQEMTNSLLNSTTLDELTRTLGRRPVFAIDRVQNTTSQKIDTDYLTKNISIAIGQSGKAVRTTVYGNESQIMSDEAAKDRFQNDTPRPKADFTLSGKILENKVQAGDVRQTTYTFHMTLIDRSGSVPWEDSRQIAKQGKKSQVGW